MKELNLIQVKLNAPKNQRNSFGNYNYRSCEDILEALKPLLKETGCTVVISDTIELIGDRYYIKATATITNEKGESVSNTAYAREPLNRKGSDESQITGATSSYARKNALNGLFCIDDNKDPDAVNEHDGTINNAPVANSKRTRKAGSAQPQGNIPMEGNILEAAIRKAQQCRSQEELMAVWNEYGPILKPQDSSRLVDALHDNPNHPDYLKYHQK